MLEESHRAGQIKNSNNTNPPEYLQTIIDSATDPILVIDNKYRISLANRHTRKLIGEEKIEPTKLHCYEISNLENSFCSCSDNPCPVKEVIKKKAPVNITRQRSDSRASDFFLEIEASPVFNDLGEVTHVIELCRTNGKLARKTGEIDPVLSEIAHGINNVMTTIVGYASLLKMRSRPGEEIYELLTKIEKAGGRGNNLMKQLYGFVKGKKFCCKNGGCKSNCS